MKNKPALHCALALASLGLAGASLHAGTLAKFEFNENQGAVTADTSGTLTGHLGEIPLPDSYPVPNADSPSGAASDKSLTIVDPSGFLVMNAAGATNLYDVTKPLTVEAWLKIPETAVPRAEGIVSFGSTWKLGLRPDGPLAMTLYGVIDANSAIYPAMGAWMHVAAVYQPGVGVSYFLDGIDAGAVEETRPMRAPLNDLLVIGSGMTAEPINASLDRVRIHQAALTAEELDAVAAAPKAPLPSTLVAFDFDEAAPPYSSKGQVQRPTVFAQDYLAGQTTPAWTNDAPSRRTSDFALSFDGNDRVLVPDPGQAINFDTGDFTVQAWVKFSNLPGARSVLFANNAAGGAISMSVTSDRRVFVTTLGIADTPSNAIIPNDGGWHHIAVVHRNGADLKFYVDGILGDTIAYTSGVVKDRTDTFFVIGGEPGGSNPYRGLMDRLQISNEALEPAALDYLAVPGVVPGTPELEISVAVSVAWPAEATGFVLQSTTNLNEPKIWSNVPATPVIVDGKYHSMFPTPGAKTFYRLVRPAQQ